MVSYKNVVTKIKEVSRPTTANKNSVFQNVNFEYICFINMIDKDRKIMLTGKCHSINPEIARIA